MPNTVGPACTVITIDEPITSDAVMMPIVARSSVRSSWRAERVEALQVEVDPGLAATRVAQQPREVARHAGHQVERAARARCGRAARRRPAGSARAIAARTSGVR